MGYRKARPWNCRVWSSGIMGSRETLGGRVLKLGFSVLGSIGSSA